MESVARAPATFANVVTAVEPSATQPPPAWARWYFVLDKEAAVAFNGDYSLVWALTPSDATLGPPGPYGSTVTIRSADGQARTIAPNPGLLAWLCDSWGTYCDYFRSLRGKAGMMLCPPQWRLLAWSLEAGKDPSGWTRSAPPYASVEEGLAQLARSPDELAAFIAAVGWRRCGSWFSRADPASAEPLSAAMGDARLKAAAGARKAGYALAIAGPVIGVVLYLSISTLVRAKGEALVAALIPAAVVFLPGVGAILYARCITRAD
jgi:hypothetical protein